MLITLNPHTNFYNDFYKITKINTNFNSFINLINHSYYIYLFIYL